MKNFRQTNKYIAAGTLPLPAWVGLKTYLKIINKIENISFKDE